MTIRTLFTRRRCLGAALLVLLLAGTAGSSRAQPIALTGGRVVTGTGETVDGGVVLFEDGVIRAVGADVAIPAGATRIDIQGRWVTPGFVNALTHVGLHEIGTDTYDATVRGDVSAAMNVLDAFNPASQVIPTVLREGTTTVVSAPSGGLVSGQAAVVDLLGARVEEMTLQAPAAVVAHLGDAARPAGGGSRAGVMARLRQLLEDARTYHAQREAYDRGQLRPLSAPAADLEALGPVLRREVPLLVTANRRSDLENALRLAREFDLRLVLAGAKEGWTVAELLAREDVPVLVDALDNIPSYDATSPRLDNAALLAAAGVKVLFATFSTHFGQELRQAAGNAVAHGLRHEDALLGLTAHPAAVFGYADRAGTLAPGQAATLVVWSGDPLELSTEAERVFVRGREVPRESRQQALMERYRERLELAD